MKKKETYHVHHPTIKEITFGDQFVLNDGEIVTFVEYHSIFNKKNIIVKIFKLGDFWYTDKLFYYSFEHDIHFKKHVKQSYISIKQKLELI